jgi:hypothetical protein
MPRFTPRKGMPSPRLTEPEFRRRFLAQFQDPAFDPLNRELDRIAAAAWEAYAHSRKAPRTHKAGSEFADPEYELSVDWLAARAAELVEAKSAAGPACQRIAETKQLIARQRELIATLDLTNQASEAAVFSGDQARAEKLLEAAFLPTAAQSFSSAAQSFSS